MKAILTYTTMIGNKAVEETKLFDTATAKKICDVVNAFKYKVQEIYITAKGVIFIRNINENSLEVANQKEIKKWIGEHEPDKYIKFSEKWRKANNGGNKGNQGNNSSNHRRGI